MLLINRQSEAEKKIAELYGDLNRRAGASPFGSCPVELTAAFLRMCLAQSCGKCVPCRVGLDRLQGLIEQVLNGAAGVRALPQPIGHGRANTPGSPQSQQNEIFVEI